MLPIIIVAVGLAAVALAAGQLARRRLLAASAAPGRHVEVDGRPVHVLEAGEGPTVVLIGGTWAPALAWQPVIERLASAARVIAVDRPGLGWSDPAPRPRTPLAMAEELHRALDAAGVDRPAVAVGHSFGGVVARVLAARYPSQVAGIVLVDAAHELQFDRFPEPVGRMAARMGTLMPRLLGTAARLVTLGLPALRPRILDGLLAGIDRLPADAQASLRGRVASDPRILRTMAGEIRDLLPGYAAVTGLGLGPGSLGGLPLRVISHGRAEGTPPGLGPEIAAAYEAAWQELQVEQAALSSRSHRRVAAGVGHDIPGEAPDVVVEAVLEVLGQVAGAAVDVPAHAGLDQPAA